MPGLQAKASGKHGLQNSSDFLISLGAGIVYRGLIMNPENTSTPSTDPPSRLPDPDLAAKAEPTAKQNGGARPVAKGSALKTISLVVLALVLVLGLAGGGWYWYYFHAKAFSPVELSKTEQQVVDGKLEIAGGDAVFAGDGVAEANDNPIILREEDRRTIVFTEREINGVLHHNTDLAEKLYIDLKQDALVAKVIYPFEEETPIVGGKTLRLNVTMKMFLDEKGKLQFTLDDVSVGGVPLPNAWLFDMKDKNLIDLDDGPNGSGLLKRIADGIADFKVENGQIRIRLKE